MNRILTWHRQEAVGNETRIGPTYYIDADYEPVAVRIYAETAGNRDVKIDIFDDGISIFANSSSRTYTSLTEYSLGTPVTSAVLGAGENGEPDAEDFSGEPIEGGSWVHCNLVDAGGGKNITVQFELHQVSEDDERED